MQITLSPNVKISQQQYVRKNNNVAFTASIPNITKLKHNENLQYCVDYFANIHRQNQIINFSELKKLGIPNLQIVMDRGVRGETLSSHRNRRFLPLIKQHGIDTIIDLRTQDSTDKYKIACEKLGFKYYHFPFDEKKVNDREILDNLPKLFDLIDKGRFYIACAQGLHRTDIALAIDYIFNPKRAVPHIMYGHTKDHNMEIQKIFTRLNSLFKAMTTKDKKVLGWTQEFEDNFKYRKQNLKRYSEMQNL